jgi:hypothetical protein
MVPFKWVGYCDESEDETTLGIACVFARAADWLTVAAPWQKLLAEYGIAEFHAVDCEHHKGPWESWTSPADRAAAARRFLAVITENPLPFPAVYATAVDLNIFEEIAAPQIRAAHPGKRLDKAWFLALHAVLDAMLHAQAISNSTFGTRELLDLICDEKDEFRGRVARWAAEVKTTTNLPLADVTFAESQSAVGLQMADLIAYEARKALTAVILDDEERGIRDEWMELMRATGPGGQRRIYGTLWDEAAMRKGNLPSGLV